MSLLRHSSKEGVEALKTFLQTDEALEVSICHLHDGKGHRRLMATMHRVVDGDVKASDFLGANSGFTVS